MASLGYQRARIEPGKLRTTWEATACCPNTRGPPRPSLQATSGILACFWEGRISLKVSDHMEEEEEEVRRGR